MPTPKKKETEKDYVERCIPIVIEEGTAKDKEQAVAICHSLYKKKKPSKDMSVTFIKYLKDKIGVK